MLLVCAPFARATDGIIDEDAGCGCYCGKTLPPPCSDQACIDACGDGSSSSDYDGQSERQLLEQQKQALIRQREAEQRRRDRKLRRETEEKENQQDFQRQKIESVNSLKGPSSAGGGGIKDFNTQGGKDTGAFGLKSVDAEDAGLRNVAAPGRHASQGAWRQLQCGEYIAGAGLAKAKALNTSGDLQEAQYLMDQGLRALAGGAVEVECGPATSAPKVRALPPDIQGHYSGTLKLARSQTELLWRAKGRLKAARQKGDAASLSTAGAEVRAATDLLNKIQQASALVPKDPAKADALFLQILEEINVSEKTR